MDKPNVDELDAAALRILVHQLYEDLRRAEMAVLAQVNRNASARDSIVRMRSRLRNMTKTLDERTVELSETKQEFKRAVDYYEAYVAGMLDAMYRIQLGQTRPDKVLALDESVSQPPSFDVPDYFRQIGEGEE